MAYQTGGYYSRSQAAEVTFRCDQNGNATFTIHSGPDAGTVIPPPPDSPFQVTGDQEEPPAKKGKCDGSSTGDGPSTGDTSDQGDQHKVVLVRGDPVYIMGSDGLPICTVTPLRRLGSSDRLGDKNVQGSSHAAWDPARAKDASEAKGSSDGLVDEDKATVSKDASEPKGSSDGEVDEDKGTSGMDASEPKGSSDGQGDQVEAASNT